MTGGPADEPPTGVPAAPEPGPTAAEPAEFAPPVAYAGAYPQVPYPAAPYPPPGDPAAYGSPVAPPRATGTDGFAIASLVLGIFGGVLLSVIFGLVALSRIKKSGGAKSGRGLAIAGLALSAFWVVVIVGFIVAAQASKPTRDSTGSVTDGGSVSFQDVLVGDCLATSPAEGEVATTQVVPCSEKHHAEVFAIFELPSGAYPGTEEVSTAAEEGCNERIPTTIDDSVADDLGLFMVYPVEANWKLGDREVVCMAESDTAFTGTITP